MTFMHLGWWDVSLDNNCVTYCRSSKGNYKEYEMCFDSLKTKEEFDYINHLSALSVVHTCLQDQNKSCTCLIPFSTIFQLTKHRGTDEWVHFHTGITMSIKTDLLLECIDICSFYIFDRGEHISRQYINGLGLH
jgi:hypothetical protein